jgi:CheY-like chemotaxis protein
MLWIAEYRSVILVVEDEFLINALTSHDLRSAGYDVVSAFNADEAIEILEHCTDIQLVFTDIDMPGSMDGLKLAAAVRDRWPPVHIIVTSGKTQPRRDELPSDTRFIPKPWHIPDVLELVRSFGN